MQKDATERFWEVEKVEKKVMERSEKVGGGAKEQKQKKKWRILKSSD